MTSEHCTMIAFNENILTCSRRVCSPYGDAVPPTLNYAGQVAVNGQAFDGQDLQVRLGQRRCQCQLLEQ